MRIDAKLCLLSFIIFITKVDFNPIASPISLTVGGKPH